MDEVFSAEVEVGTDKENAEKKTNSKENQPRKDSVQTIIKEQEEADLYTRRSKLFAKIQLILLLLTAAAYIIYGVIKVVESYSNPSTKYSEKSVKYYDYPSVITCMNGSGISENGTGDDYYLLVKKVKGSGDVCDDDSGSSDPPLCTSYEKESYTYDKTDRSSWQFYYGNVISEDGEDLYCILILPPSNIQLEGDKKTGGKYEVTYEVHKTGMFDPDITFGSNVSTLAFLVRQYQYSVEHQAFHIDELYTAFSDWEWYEGDTLTADELLEVAYDAGTDDFYAPPCSRNDLQLSLTTTQAYSGSKTNAFSTANFGASIDTVMFGEGNCKVGLYYYPKTKGKNKKEGTNLFYQSYAEEYLEYDVAALFSGIGGITGTAQSVLGAIIPLILAGISISLLGIQWKGYAPLPKFDEDFEQKLERFLRTYLYNHRASISTYLKQ